MDAVADMDVRRCDDVAVAMSLTFLEGRRDTVATVVDVADEDGGRRDVAAVKRTSDGVMMLPVRIYERR